MDEDELMKSYELSAHNVKLLEMALKPSDYYIKKEIQGTEITSSAISTNTLETVLMVNDIKDSFRIQGKFMPVAYGVTTYFCWLKPFLLTFTDEMFVCWGGELNSNTADESSSALYATSSGENIFSKEDNTIVEQQNLSLKYYFQTRIQKWYKLVYKSHFLQAGVTYARLYQLKKNNYATKVIACYAHKILSLSGVGFSVDKKNPISISVSFGYDTSIQMKHDIVT